MLRGTLAARAVGATPDSLETPAGVPSSRVRRRRAHLQRDGPTLETAEVLAALDVLEDVSGNVSRAALERLLSEQQRSTSTPHRGLPLPSLRPAAAAAAAGGGAHGSSTGKSRAAAWKLAVWAALALAAWAVSRPGQQPQLPRQQLLEQEQEQLLQPPRRISGFEWQPGSWQPRGSWRDDELRSDGPFDPHARLLQSGGGGGGGGSACVSPCILPSACPASATPPTAPPPSLPPVASPPAANATAATASGNATAASNATADAPAEEAEAAPADAAAAPAVLEGADPNTLLLLIAALLLGVPFIITVGMTYFFCIKRP